MFYRKPEARQLMMKDVNRMSSELENLENLEVSGNLKTGPEGRGKVGGFRENSASERKVREFWGKLSCIPSVSDFSSFTCC